MSLEADVYVFAKLARHFHLLNTVIFQTDQTQSVAKSVALRLNSSQRSESSK